MKASRRPFRGSQKSLYLRMYKLHGLQYRKLVKLKYKLPFKCCTILLHRIMAHALTYMIRLYHNFNASFFVNYLTVFYRLISYSSHNQLSAFFFEQLKNIFLHKNNANILCSAKENYQNNEDIFLY